MLNLNDHAVLPKFTIKDRNGKEHDYESLVLGFALRDLQGVEDPLTIQKIVSKALGFELDTYDATVILKDFFEFAQNTLEEPLKKVFGSGLFSTSTSVSAPENSKR